MVLWNYIHNAYQGRGKQRTNYMSLAVGGGAWGILPKGSDLIGVSKDAQNLTEWRGQKERGNNSKSEAGRCEQTCVSQTWLVVSCGWSTVVLDQHEGNRE